MIRRSMAVVHLDQSVTANQLLTHRPLILPVWVAHGFVKVETKDFRAHGMVVVDGSDGGWYCWNHHRSCDRVEVGR